LRDKKLLAVGHAHGFLCLWSIGRRFELTLGPIVDLRNPEPVNPWALHNIRGIAVLMTTQQHGWIITGSEDGWMCVVRVPQGDVVSRSLYNADAERGINTISATNGGLLLVGNCSVGPEDSSLWYYVVRAGEWMPVLRDRANLRIDPETPQVFNFSTIWIARHGALSWCASTEEGALWMGTLTPDAELLRLLGYPGCDRPAGFGSFLWTEWTLGDGRIRPSRVSPPSKSMITESEARQSKSSTRYPSAGRGTGVGPVLTLGPR
jgi:hypothetical protein